MQAQLTLLPGDGVGPEVIAAARQVLDTVAAQAGHTFTYDEQLLGGCAIDATGEPLPEATCASEKDTWKSKLKSSGADETQSNFQPMRSL